MPHHAVPWLNTCFCFIGVSCKPQEATPARVSGSTFFPSSSTLHLGQSFHPHITVYFYPYYKTGLESQIKTASIFQLISFQMTGSRPSASRNNVQKRLSTEKQNLGPSSAEAAGEVLGSYLCSASVFNLHNRHNVGTFMVRRL